jgi:hypothetical protein
MRFCSRASISRGREGEKERGGGGDGRWLAARSMEGKRLEARRSSLSSVRPRVPLPIFRQPLDTIAVHR